MRPTDHHIASGENMNRSTALDSLRGLAIIGMVFSGTIATSLPSWMYHAQVGPRSGMKFDASFPGITWVDLVFPFFLFAMGAAIPLALSSKLQKGSTSASLVPAILKRFFLLAFFAVAIYHTTPYRVGGEWNYALALLAFVLFFLSFVRLPKASGSANSILRLPLSRETANTVINYSGMALLAGLIAFNVVSQPEVFRQGFKLSHNDIILLVLANMAVFGSIVWMLTRTNVTLRLALMAFLLALRLTSDAEGSWNQWIWNFNPMQWLPESVTALVYTPGGWLYRMDFLKYLLIVLPGTIAGDILLQGSMKHEKTDASEKWRMIAFLILMIAFVISNLACLYSRWLTVNLVINLILSGVGFLILATTKSTFSRKFDQWFSRNSGNQSGSSPDNPLSMLYKRLYSWGTGWLLLGTAFEAFEGGIRKDHATISYFFVTAGLAIFTFLFFSILIDYFGKGKGVKYISDCGQNPMLAYVAGTFVMVPLLVFAGLMPSINRLYELHPWLGIVKGLIITGGMMAITVVSVRLKWFWKT
jgi:predicted acyltransferase